MGSHPEGLLRGIDVCAGSGIGSFVFERIGLCRTVCYIERDSYCQRILVQRMRDGQLAEAPIHGDLRGFDGRPWRGVVDFVFGGPPCQGFSVAGKRLGESDDRNLWPDFLRVVREVRPGVVLLENVPGLLSSRCDGESVRETDAEWLGDSSAEVGRYFGTILRDLAEAGYDAEWASVGAVDVGAPHRRKRVWVVAYAAHL